MSKPLAPWRTWRRQARGGLLYCCWRPLLARIACSAQRRQPLLLQLPLLPPLCFWPAVGAVPHVALFVSTAGQLALAQGEEARWRGPLIRAFMVGGRTGRGLACKGMQGQGGASDAPARHLPCRARLRMHPETQTTCPRQTAVCAVCLPACLPPQDRDDPNPPVSADALAPYALLGPSIRMADAFLAAAVQLGKPALCWTVDAPRELHRGLELGANAGGWVRAPRAVVLSRPSCGGRCAALAAAWQAGSSAWTCKQPAPPPAP